MSYSVKIYYGDEYLGSYELDRWTIYDRMKQYNIKHYIVSCCFMDEEGHRHWQKYDGFHKCHYNDKEFDDEIALLERQGYNYFDVIHNHEWKEKK